MAWEWNLPTPIYDLSQKLCVEQKIATEGGNAPSYTQMVCIGYNMIQKGGLSDTTCREWQEK